jgi:hypothetical protein
VRVVRFTPEKQTSLNLVPSLRRLGQVLPGRLVAAEQHLLAQDGAVSCRNKRRFAPGIGKAIFQGGIALTVLSAPECGIAPFRKEQA